MLHFAVVTYHVRLCLNLHESCSFGWLVKDGIRCGGSWVFEDGDGVSGFVDGVWMGGVLLLDVCEYFLLVHGGFLLFVNKIISPLDTSLEFVRGVGKSGFVVFYVLCTVFFNML